MEHRVIERTAAAGYPEITFSSTSVEPAAAGGWTVSGRAREVTFLTVAQEGRYRGPNR